MTHYVGGNECHMTTTVIHYPHLHMHESSYAWVQ